MKKMKVDSESSRFKILREVVINLQNKHDRQELTPVPITGVKARLRNALKELQEICPHENIAELMSSWSPKKTPKAKLIYQSGRICLDCGIKELTSETKGHFYRILPEPSFFANFSDILRFKNIRENPAESGFVFRKLEELLEENLQKEVAKIKS